MNNVGYLTNEQYNELLVKYDNSELQETSKQKLVVNPKVAYELTDEMIRNNIPYDKLKTVENIYGKISKMSEYSPVSNTVWDYFYFVNSDVFRPAALLFQKSVKHTGSKKSAAYCSYPKGSKAYNKFWQQEFDRIINGYEPEIDGQPCGIRITGEFYFYLNYTLMDFVEEVNGKTIKKVDFPPFLTMDYYYFNELDARENPDKYGFDAEYKLSMAVAKSRRKGFSYKCAAGCVWIAAFNNDARVVVASAPDSTKTDAFVTVSKCLRTIDHLSNYTPFGRKNLGNVATNGGWKNEVTSIDGQTSIKITLGEFNTITKEKTGRQSSIITTLLSKDDALSGEGIHRLYIEEAGKVSNLDKVWTFGRESLKAGSLYRGIAVIFGTGGDMVGKSGKGGNSKPFSNLFNNPELNDLAAYENIYEYQYSSAKCGYFVSDMWFNTGGHVILDGKRYDAIDKQGNAIFWVAEASLNKDRNAKSPKSSGGSINAYNDFLTQRCKTPKEAFFVSTTSVFNTADIIARQSYINSMKLGFNTFRRNVELNETSEGNVVIVEDFDNKLSPIVSMNYDNSNREGCLIIYEDPLKINGVIPDDAYLISCDPIGNNEDSGKSLTAIIVYKTPLYSMQLGYEGIVATYVGRAKYNPMDYVLKLLVRLSKLYNAKITYENDRDNGILQYFQLTNNIHRLLPYPKQVGNIYLNGSATNIRKFGHSVGSTHHKSLGEILVKEWLDFRHPNKKGINESGEIVEELGLRNVDLLKDELLMEQLTAYNREGNFDLVMALMGVIIQRQEKFYLRNNTVIRDKLTDLQKWANKVLKKN